MGVPDRVVRAVEYENTVQNETSFSRRMDPGTSGLVVLCLLASGLCALVYQMAWFREFRLIFGASTPATGAVLAIFMGGIGLGSWLIGKRADRQVNPLRLYARLELGIATTAALTPGLLWLCRHAYIGLGGTLTLGMFFGTLMRLLLAVLVLGIPTLLMGGTLPAVARALQGAGDLRRRQVALAFGANTLGAVTGVCLATFWMFEHWGNRWTLWSACGLNLGIAFLAWQLSRRATEVTGISHGEIHHPTAPEEIVP